jgi:hypothetical protein
MSLAETAEEAQAAGNAPVSRKGKGKRKRRSDRR